MKIGIFDSGIGGLTLLKELLDINQKLDFFYLGDNKYCPYGKKSELEIKNRILKIIEFFRKEGCEKIIIACNTASIIAEKYNLLDEYIIGISQIIKAELIKIDNFIIYGTEVTINSKYYELENKNIFNISSKDLAKLIESEHGLDRKNKIKKCIEKDLSSLDKKYDKLILCCTHYPIVLKEIRSIFKFEVYNFNQVISKKILFNFKKNEEEFKQKIYFTSSIELYEKIFLQFFKIEASIIDIE